MYAIYCEDTKHITGSRKTRNEAREDLVTITKYAPCTSRHVIVELPTLDEARLHFAAAYKLLADLQDLQQKLDSVILGKAITALEEDIALTREVISHLSCMN